WLFMLASISERLRRAKRGVLPSDGGSAVGVSRRGIGNTCASVNLCRDASAVRREAEAARGSARASSAAVRAEADPLSLERDYVPRWCRHPPVRNPRSRSECATGRSCDTLEPGAAKLRRQFTYSTANYTVIISGTLVLSWRKHKRIAFA